MEMKETRSPKFIEKDAPRESFSKYPPSCKTNFEPQVTFIFFFILPLFPLLNVPLPSFIQSNSLQKTSTALRSLLLQRERSKDKGETAIAYFTPNSDPKIPIVVIVHRAKIYLWESELSSAPFHSVALDHHHHAGLLTSISILGSEDQNEIFYVTVGKLLYCLTYRQRVLIVTGKYELGDVVKSLGVVAQNTDPTKVFLSVGFCSGRVILFRYDPSSPDLQDHLVLLSRIDHYNVTDIACLKSIQTGQLILVTSEKASNMAHVWLWSLPNLSSASIISPPLPLKLDQGLAVTCVDICLHATTNQGCVCYVLTTGINRMKLWLLHLNEEIPYEEFMVSWMPNRKGIQGAKILQIQSQQTVLIGLASRDRSFQVLNIVNGQVVKSLTDLGHLTQLAILTQSPVESLSSSRTLKNSLPTATIATASTSINVAVITVGSSISAHSINLGATEILCPNLFAGKIHTPLFAKTTITHPLALRSSSSSSQTRFALDNSHFCLNPTTCSISSQCAYCATCCQEPSSPEACRKCSHSSVVVYQFIVVYSSNEYDPREIFFYPLSPLHSRPVWSGYLVPDPSNSSYEFQLRIPTDPSRNQIHLRIQFVFSFTLCSISYLAISFEEEVRSSKRTKILFVQMTETGPGDITVLCNPSSSNHYSCPESIHKLSVFNHLHDVVIISTINELNGTLTCFFCDSELLTTGVIEIRDSHRLLNDVHLAPVSESLPLMVCCGNDNLIRVYENYCPPVTPSVDIDSVEPDKEGAKQDAEEGRSRSRPKILQGHRDDVTCLTSLLSDGNKYPYIISGSSDCSIRIWAYPLGTLIRVFTGHKLEITSLAICSDAENLSPVIISGSCDKTIRLWSFNTGEEFRRLEIPHDRPSAAGDINTVNIALPNQSSQFNLIGSNDNGIVTVWDMTMMIRGLSPLPDDIFLDFMRDCKGQRSQSSLETLSSAWPRMLELFDRYGSHEILFQNPRIFSIAVLWDKPSFIRHFLHHCPDAVTNCQWSSNTRENCSDLEYEHINERQTNYRTYWKNFLEIDTLGTDAATAALAAEVQSKEHPFVTQSLLFFAMVCQSKSAVEAVTEAMTSILLIPPIDSPYSMYHHLSRTIPSSDLALLAHNYPLIFQSFITALKPIEANFLVFDLTLNPDPKFYIDPDVTALHSGTETPAADRGLWPRFAERKMMKAIEQKKKSGKGDSLNASALMPMFIPLPNTASLLFLRSVLQVCETLEDSSLFHASVVHFSLRFIWQKIGLRVHVWLMKEYILFVFLYSAACSQFGTEYFGSSIDISISIFLHSLLLILVLQLTVQEYIQFSYSNFWDHLRDFWNLIDITNIVVCVGGAVLRAAYQRETSLSRICFAVGFLTVYGRLLYFLRAFKSVGPLVSMILRIGHHIRFFTLILLLELIAFAGAFRMMTNDSSSENSTYFSSLFVCILYMFGSGEMEYHTTASPFITRALYLLFLFTINILLLNLLIALMGDAYNTVAESTISEWRLEQCKLTFEHLSFTKRVVQIVKKPAFHWMKLSSKDLLSKKHFPMTLHLLFRASDVLNSFQDDHHRSLHPHPASGSATFASGSNRLSHENSERISASETSATGRSRGGGGLGGSEYEELRKRLYFIEEQLRNFVKLQFHDSDGAHFQTEKVRGGGAGAGGAGGGSSQMRKVLYNQIHHRNVDTDDDSDYDE